MTDSTRIQRIDESLAPDLLRFYEELSVSSKRTFHPLGDHTTLASCEAIARDNASEEKHDLIALRDDRIVGWAFLWDLRSESPVFGLAVADDCHGKGMGGRLMDRALDYACERRIRQVVLTVVKDNERARGLYERRGFLVYDEFVGEDALPYFRMRLTLRES
jgi:ribosomal protein S18 acetylase RimI-like enzyme